MKKVQKGEFTDVFLTGDEAKTICRIGQDSKCCAFLTVSINGFMCEYKSSEQNTIWARLKAGTMNARGVGTWKGCAWEKQ